MNANQAGTRICAIDGCDKPGDSRGTRRHCAMHRARIQKHGSAELPAKPTSEDKFRDRFETQESGCWRWNASVLNSGYGRFNPDGVDWLAHRWSYTYFVAPIPDSLQIDHLCRNRLCVNPAHLEPVTSRENCIRAKAIVTHCPQGHPYEGPNLYVSPRGARLCRECHRASDRRRAARKVAA